MTEPEISRCPDCDTPIDEDESYCDDCKWSYADDGWDLDYDDDYDRDEDE
jgi:hypothetical protein